MLRRLWPPGFLSGFLHCTEIQISFQIYSSMETMRMHFITLHRQKTLLTIRRCTEPITCLTHQTSSLAHPMAPLTHQTSYLAHPMAPLTHQTSYLAQPMAPLDGWLLLLMFLLCSGPFPPDSCQLFLIILYLVRNPSLWCLASSSS